MIAIILGAIIAATVLSLLAIVTMFSARRKGEPTENLPLDWKN